MKAVPGYSHLVRRGAVYWLRRRVPTDICPQVPFAEWKESLGTSELEEAKRRLRVRLVEIDKEISLVRAKVAGEAHQSLTRQEAVQIAQARLAEWLSDDAEARMSDGPAAWDNAEAWLEARSAEDREALATGNWRSAERITEMALEACGRWYPKGDPSVQLLAGELLKVQVQFADLIKQRQRGEVVEAPDVALPPVASARPAGQPIGSAGGFTVGELIRQYRAARETEHTVESTNRKYSHIFKALEEVLGVERPVAAVTRADCRALRDLLTVLPSSAGKRYPGLTLHQAVEAARRDGAPVLAPNTVTTYVQSLAAVFNWAVDEELIDKSPARGLVKKGRANVKRRGLNAAELQTLFSALAPFREEVPSRFWVPALALYLGARLNELCQLATSDIGVEDGIAFINFSEFDHDTGERIADRSLKNAASDRRLPIHAELIAAGFVTFVECVRDGGGGRLFPECKLGPDGRYSHGLSRWFGRAMDALGMPQRSLVFHSFRHGFKDVCRDADISQEIADALGGWHSARVAAGYGERGRLKLLARASAKVAFDGFALAQIVSTVPALHGYRLGKPTPSPQKKDD